MELENDPREVTLLYGEILLTSPLLRPQEKRCVLSHKVTRRHFCARVVTLACRLMTANIRATKFVNTSTFTVNRVIGQTLRWTVKATFPPELISLWTY